MATTITTGKVRFSYVHLFTPFAPNGVGEPKYSVSLLVDKNDTATIEKINSAIEEAKEQGKTSKWGGKIPNKLATPLNDGDDKEDANYQGKFYLNAKNSRKPGVVDKDVQAILDPDEVYSGCYGRANITFYPYSASGNNGIAVSLNHIQKLSDGEPLSGGVSVSAAFADSFDDFLD